MSDYTENIPENGEPVLPWEDAEELDIALPRKKGFTKTAWVVIIALVGVLVARSHWQDEEALEAPEQLHVQDIVFEVQARYLIGVANNGMVPVAPQDLYQEAQSLDRGSWQQRLKFVVLAGELAGPKEALEKATELRRELGGWLRPEIIKGPGRIATVLINLYRDYVAGDFRAASIGEVDRAFLRENLPWFGELALHPREGTEPPANVAAVGGAAPAIVLDNPPIDPVAREAVLAPAQDTFLGVIAVVGGVCFLSFVGFVGLVVFVVFLAKGVLRGGLTTGSNYGGVYAETFALFLLVFIGGSFGFQRLPWDVSPLVKMSLALPASLVVVVWPVLRGIPWSQVRQDIGWTLGRNPALEPVLGVTCYVLNLPVVIVGFALTLLLMVLRNQLDAIGLGTLAQHEPTHPIVNFIINGSAFDRLVVIIDACVFAPIVEETIFRGILYRHLRELSSRWRWFWSVIFSGTLVSFIFAAIHPQGLVAVPVLMALAYGFTTAREWRGTLIPSMVGHALNNGLVVMLVIAMLGH